MALCVAGEFCGQNILNTPFVNFSGRYVARCYQVPQPLRGIRVVFVVVGGHRWRSSNFFASCQGITRRSTRTQAMKPPAPVS
jgi:ABC-type branched-subunit amino acid transport system ATPase component